MDWNLCLYVQGCIKGDSLPNTVPSGWSSFLLSLLTVKQLGATNQSRAQVGPTNHSRAQVGPTNQCNDQVGPTNYSRADLGPTNESRAQVGSTNSKGALAGPTNEIKIQWDQWELGIRGFGPMGWLDRALLLPCLINKPNGLDNLNPTTIVV